MSEAEIKANGFEKSLGMGRISIYHSLTDEIVGIKLRAYKEHYEILKHYTIEKEVIK